MRNIFAKVQKKALEQGLTKTKQSFWHKMHKAIAGRSKVDEVVLDELEVEVGVLKELELSDHLEVELNSGALQELEELMEMEGDMIM